MTCDYNLPKLKMGVKMKFKNLFLSAVLLVASVIVTSPSVSATTCPELKLVFARGSGGERWHDQNYLAFKTALESKLSPTRLNYEFEDLDYAAVGLDFFTALGAFFGGGEAYRFGDSVNQGVANLINLVNHQCPQTKYVIAGYSQGAMVVSKALKALAADKVIYAATFGDPKIYLPEGAGPMPVACQGQNLSSYRIYVPDCYAYLGKLGTQLPYQPASFEGKYGTWCNKTDIFCSSYLSITSHTSYVRDNLYEDASRVIFSKITTAFGLANHYVSPHDTAILIDATGSMAGLIEQYKAEALNLAEQTINSGGRVALYDYRDLDDPYEPHEHCGFETCTLSLIQTSLNQIRANGGGDTPESLLSASLTVMKKQTWRQGSTKSLVVLTDAGYLDPDRDLTTFAEVVKLSKQIDPVNFYIITTDENLHAYQNLASATGGQVVSSASDLSILTSDIIARFDSLPRVEESTAPQTYLKVALLSVDDNYDNITLRFRPASAQTLVVMNDAILGVTEASEITIGSLDRSRINEIALLPISETARGEATIVSIEPLVLLGAPDTGRATTK